MNVIVELLGMRSWLFGLLALSTVLYGRILTELGGPAVVKFFHFALVAIFAILLLPFLSNSISWSLVYGLLLLSWVMVLSAVINGAGLLNILLDFLILSEPFLLLVLMINRPMSKSQIQTFRWLLVVFICIHVGLSFAQALAGGGTDDVKGVFLEQGAGHHVAGAVALTAAVYFFTALENFSLPVRAIISLIIASVVILSDSKQVIAVFLLGLGCLLCTKLGDIRKFFIYVLLFMTSGAVLLFSAFTIFPALTTWADLNLILKGLTVKFGILPLLFSHYDSVLNWIFGLGPGHTVGKLAFMLPQYEEQLRSLSVSFSSVTQHAWNYQQGNYLSHSVTGSSMWSPFFFWAGLWGDLGILGVVSYGLLWVIVILRICTNDLARFLAFTVLIFGIVFSWLEEPGYMLFVVTIIGLSWQEQQSRLPMQGLEMEKESSLQC
ncbi:hypothetical protein PJI16_11300 [Nitrospira sp. MA-1]|nr:hypothetical protein [Nitrospira sp. MA-1]